MKNKLKLILIPLCYSALLAMMLGGCSNSDATPTKNTETKKEETKKEETDLNKNDTGKTAIKAISLNASYPNNSYMIISKSGTVIVADPTQVQDGIKPDVITSTHDHPDHNDPNIYSKNKCKSSLYTIESFSEKDVRVFSIASTHFKDTPIDKAKPSNVVYVYEVDGLRIAHMGDIAQEQFTDEQLQALGKIDIAFMQFVNSYSDYSLENGKGFKLIEQLKPQIIIPTHSTPAANKEINSIVGKYETLENILTISKDDLKDGIRKVIEIKNTLK